MKLLVVVAKIIISVALLAVLLPRIDTDAMFLLIIEPTALIGILIAVLVLLIQALLAAFRQVTLVDLLGEKLTLRKSVQVWFAGLFVSQALVTFIAGDVVRAVQLKSAGIPRRIAGRAIVLDRFVGLLALFSMVIAVTPFLLSLANVRGLRFSLLILCLLSAGGIIVLLAGGLLGRVVALLPWALMRHKVTEVLIDLMSVTRFLVRAPLRSLQIFFTSLVMHVLNIVAILSIACMIGVDAPSLPMGAIMVPVMLLTMLPISFAGWGVREAATVTGLGLLGIRPEIALMISVCFGASMILASLPGLPVILARRAKQPSFSTPPAIIRPE